MEEIEKINEQLKRKIQLLEKEVKELKNIEESSRRKNDNKSERYYRSILNHMHEDILVIDKNFRVTDVNRKFLKTLGRKREETIGQYCYKVSHGFDRPCEELGEACPLLKVFETGQVQTVWHQHKHAGGWQTWVDLLLSPLTDEEGNVTHVIKAIRDVSDLVKVGKSLEESEEKYRRVIASYPD